MIDHKNYSELMNEIHVPSEVLGKVINMKKDVKAINRKKVFRTITTAAAALLSIFLASNAVCYAASGKTWVESVIVYINGEASEQEITYTQEGDCVTGTLQFEVDETENPSLEVEFVLPEDALADDSSAESVPIDIEATFPNYDDSMTEQNTITFEDASVEYVPAERVVTGDSSSVSLHHPYLEDIDGTLYLICSDDMKIDLTDKYCDGVYTGEYTIDGVTTTYTVTGNAEEYTIELREE